MAKAGPDDSTNGLALIPEDTALLQESFLWDKDVVLRAGLGYKDNVLLAPSSPQGSPFFTSGLDFTLFRLPLDGLEFSLALTGDDTRYWHNPGGVNAEDLFLASAKAQKYFGGNWRVGLEARYIYADQVVETLIDTGGVHAVEAKGDTLGLRPFLRRDLGTNWWVQLEGNVGREWWEAPLDDQWKYGGQLTLGFNYGHRSQVTLAAGGAYITHDDYLARDATGAVLDGKRLAVWQPALDLKWEHRWDARRQWTSTTKLGVHEDRDNGGRYFDYYRYQAAEELGFRTRNWELKGAASIAYYDFPVQTVAPPPSFRLYLSMVDFTVRVERRLYGTLRCFASFEHDQTLSNDAASQYKANIGMGGLSWEF